MKIVCQSCGKKYDTDKDELCPRCGSYNPFSKEGGVQQETSAERYVRQQMEQEKQRQEKLYEQADEPSFDLKREEETQRTRREFSQRKEEERQAAKQNRGCLGSVIAKFFLFILLFGLLSEGLDLLEVTVGRVIRDRVQSDRMQVEEYQADQLIELENGASLAVHSMQRFDLPKDLRVRLEDGELDLDGMQLAAVMVNVDEQAGDFLSYGEQDVYLRSDRQIYRRMEYWMESAVEEVFGIGSAEYAQADEPSALFFLIPADSSGDYQLCVQETKELPWIQIDVVDRLSIVELGEGERNQ
ncbi:MAG: hypothetical protein UI647_07480 [Negativibacillus sp.]